MWNFTFVSSWPVAAVLLAPGIAVWASVRWGERRRGVSAAFYAGSRMSYWYWVPSTALVALAMFTPVRWGPVFIAGLVLLAVGLLIIAIAVREFAGRREGLVISGIYRYCRNPMTDGVAWLYLGAVLMVGSASLLNGLLAGLAAVGAIHSLHVMVVLEEGRLEESYGDNYRAYRRRVPRYLFSAI
jgi:protein-S-isoprenylcysteine O-methyltransferase Ste14